MATTISDDQNQTFTGQLMHRRRLSGKLVFYDLLLDAPLHTSTEAVAPETASAEPQTELLMDQTGDTPLEMELMLKADGLAGGCLPIQEVQRLRADLKLGDRVRVVGTREVNLSGGPAVLHCRQMKVLQRWAEMQPQTAFVPQPFKKHGSTSACTDAAPAGAIATVVPSTRQPTAGKEPSAPLEKRKVSARAGQSAADAREAAAGMDTEEAATREDAPGWTGRVCKFWINSQRCAMGELQPPVGLLFTSGCGLPCTCGRGCPICVGLASSAHGVGMYIRS
ncbi:hypothetical protein CYMTET_54094 [Cymbomonas tetramitiformis]|uniref:Uncharacterized protein n=1 Tax=Cymbomonas tetramitiformis TaxID=36881 RepID=A0AAE0BFN7_9CHLO|nr:hypothetical protein CYMTET_54094 [Cymbomonas tetramitiformis]